MAQLVLHSIAT